MILALSRPPYDIGARRAGCNDGTGRWHPDQAFVIVREVTFNDWLEYREANGNRPIRPDEVRTIQHDRFFEVSTD